MVYLRPIHFVLFYHSRGRKTSPSGPAGSCPSAAGTAPAAVRPPVPLRLAKPSPKSKPRRVPSSAGDGIKLRAVIPGDIRLRNGTSHDGRATIFQEIEPRPSCSLLPRKPGGTSLTRERGRLPGRPRSLVIAQHPTVSRQSPACARDSPPYPPACRPPCPGCSPGRGTGSWRARPSCRSAQWRPPGRRSRRPGRLFY